MRSRDETGDAKLRACALDVVRRTRFPRPVRSTFVNFGTDVTLAPPPRRQRACVASHGCGAESCPLTLRHLPSVGGGSDGHERSPAVADRAFDLG